MNFECEKSEIFCKTYLYLRVYISAVVERNFPLVVKLFGRFSTLLVHWLRTVYKTVNSRNTLRLTCFGRVAHSFIHSFIHSVVFLTADPQPLPKRVLHSVRSSAFFFNFQYSLFSFMSFSSCLRLLPHFPVTSIRPSIFPSVTCVRRHFLGKTNLIKLAFFLCTVCRIFIFFLTLCNTSSFLILSIQLILPILCQHHISKLSWYFWSTFRSAKVSEARRVAHKLKISNCCIP